MDTSNATPFVLNGQTTTMNDLEHISMPAMLQLLRSILPMLENVKHSIQESSQVIPKASQQITKITNATESATVEIMNVVDALSGHIKQSNALLEKITECSEAISANILAALKNHQEMTPKEFYDSFPGIFESSAAIMPLLAEHIASLKLLLTKTKEYSMKIMIALQVQDITSQQLAGVSHIIDSIEAHLHKVIVRFETGKESSAPLENALPRAYDSNAEYTSLPNRQDDADDIVREWANSSKP